MTARRRVTANTATFSCSLATAASVASAAGYDGLEVWSHDVGMNEAYHAEVARLFRQKNLAISALQLLRDFEGCPASQRAAKLAEAEGLMATMASIGATTLLLCSNVSADSSSDRARAVADLRELASMAASRGLRIAFEPLSWSRWINDYTTAWNCVEAVGHDSLGIAIDCFHLFYRNTPLRFMETVPIGKCLLVQLCDAVRMELPAIEISRHHRLFPGEGVWPVAQLVRMLNARGYDGYYNVEVMNDNYLTEEPADVAERGIAAFRRLFEDPPA